MVKKWMNEWEGFSFPYYHSGEMQAVDFFSLYAFVVEEGVLRSTAGAGPVGVQKGHAPLRQC